MTAFLPLGGGTLIVVIVYLALRVASNVGGGGGGAGRADEYGPPSRRGPNMRGGLAQVIIILVGAYALRVTPLVGSLVALMKRIEENVAASVAWNTIPLIAIGIFLWFTLAPPGWITKYNLAKLWMVLLVLSVLVLSISASWIEPVMQFLLSGLILIWNVVTSTLNILWNVKFS